MGQLTVDRTAAFELEDVTRVYGNTSSTEPQFLALRQVCLSIPAGAFTTIVGPSGSGKSTLLGLLGLLDRPSEGRVTIAGHETAHLSERDRCRLRAVHLGFVFQSFHLMQDRTVLENVMLGGLYRGLTRRQRQLESSERLADMGLADKLTNRAATLSGGERQRVAIARALVGSPDILLCDEPTGNLDSTNGELVVAALRTLADQGITVVMVTHDPAIAAMGNHRIQVRDGRVNADAAFVR